MIVSLARFLLRWSAPADLREFVEGDFLEELAEVEHDAQWWAWRYALTSIWPFLQMRWNRTSPASLFAKQLGAIAAGGATFAALRGLRFYILVQVPMRAADEPTLARLLLEGVVVLCAGAIGSLVAHHLYSDIKKGTPT